MLMGISNINRTTTAITTALGEPDWSYIPSAGKCKKTKETLLSEIKELAVKSASAGSEREKEQINKQVLKLRADYLSDVAPDRRNLYCQAENALKGQNGKQDGKQTDIGELPDYLEDRPIFDSHA